VRAKLLVAALLTSLVVCAWAAIGGAATKRSTTTVGPGEADSTDVRCKKDQRVVAVNAVGESGSLFVPDPAVVIGEISRPGKRRARARGFNYSMTAGDLSVIARCKRQPKSKLESESITIPPAGMELETASVSAKCPRGEGIVFGGFRAEQRPADDPDNPILIPIKAKRHGARAWQVEAFNLADGPDDAGELRSLAYCGDVKKTKAHAETVAVDPLETESATARCPRGTKVRYGGFEGTATTDGAILTTGLERTGRRTFQASGLALSMTPLDLTAIAYCR
jgi:hypothetical protein